MSFKRKTTICKSAFHHVKLDVSNAFRYPNGFRGSLQETIILFGRQSHSKPIQVVPLHDKNELSCTLWAVFHRAGRVTAIEEDSPPNCDMQNNQWRPPVYKNTPDSPSLWND